MKFEDRDICDYCIYRDDCDYIPDHKITECHEFEVDKVRYERLKLCDE